MSQRRGNRILRVVLSTTSLVLPAITLVPLGSLWLWEHGYLLHWAVVALVLVGLGMLLQWWLLREPAALATAADDPLRYESASARERAARQSVDAYIKGLTAETVQGEAALRDLAVATIKLVAEKMHPGESQPQWNFTVPEALLLTERVAARLRPVVVDNVPLGDQLTVRQVIKLYNWRIAVDWAERAYDIWRIVRLLNPAAAITHEARERLSKKVYSTLKDEFTVRLAQGYVHEVAEAAIDLYSGRLRIGQHGERIVTTEAEVPVPDIVPPRDFVWSRFGRQAKNVGRFAAKTLLRRR